MKSKPTSAVIIEPFLNKPCDTGKILLASSSLNALMSIQIILYSLKDLVAVVLSLESVAMDLKLFPLVKIVTSLASLYTSLGM